MRSTAVEGDGRESGDDCLDVNRDSVALDFPLPPLRLVICVASRSLRRSK